MKRAKSLAEVFVGFFFLASEWGWQKVKMWSNSNQSYLKKWKNTRKYKVGQEINTLHDFNRGCKKDDRKNLIDSPSEVLSHSANAKIIKQLCQVVLIRIKKEKNWSLSKLHNNYKSLDNPRMVAVLSRNIMTITGGFAIRHFLSIRDKLSGQVPFPYTYHCPLPFLNLPY